MALIKCPECEKEISDKAKNCPHCGCPLNEHDSTNSYVDDNFVVKSVIKKPNRKIIIIVLAVILAIAVGIIIFLIAKPDDSDSKKTLNTIETTATTTVTTTVTTTTTTTTTTVITTTEMSDEQKKQSVVKALNKLLAGTNMEATYDEPTDSYIVTAWADNVSDLVIAAKVDETAREEWEQNVESFQDVIKNFRETVKTVDPEANITFELLNETNKDKALLVIYNDIIIYDAVENE